MEGLGIALLEAAARGRPLVAGRHGGVPEIVFHGGNGFLVDPADPADVAARVVELFDDPARAAEMGADGRRRVAERFLASRMAEEYRSLLAAVASAR